MVNLSLTFSKEIVAITAHSNGGETRRLGRPCWSSPVWRETNLANSEFIEFESDGVILMTATPQPTEHLRFGSTIREKLKSGRQTSCRYHPKNCFNLFLLRVRAPGPIFR